MWVKVYPCIRKIMNEYKDDERCFNFHRRYTTIGGFNRALSLAFKKYVENNKLEKFTFYSARHSWATIGRSKLCEIDKSVITAGLCHVDPGARVDDIYIKFDWELLWDAQKKILDVFNWE
jgi:integrase